MTRPPKPRRAKLLRCIPPVAVLQRKLAENRDEARQLAELLRTAERLEQAEAQSLATETRGNANA
jgi:hypothetical protein